jgi:hypothetical protein
MLRPAWHQQNARIGRMRGPASARMLYFWARSRALAQINLIDG